jgi:hypothetical protein
LAFAFVRLSFLTRLRWDFIFFVFFFFPEGGDDVESLSELEVAKDGELPPLSWPRLLVDVVRDKRSAVLLSR